MREIKFRAWHTRDEGEKMITEIISSTDGTISGVDSSDILMQYTGLKDKNGVEIYEGDIVVTNNNKNFEVAYRGASFDVISLEKNDRNILNYSDYLGYANDIGLKVIGNIYENPELLNE